MNIEVDQKELTAIQSGVHSLWLRSSGETTGYSDYLWRLLQRLRTVEEGAAAMAGQPAYSEGQGWNLTGEDDGSPIAVGDTIKIVYTKHPWCGQTGKVIRVFDSGEQMDVQLKDGRVTVAIDDMEVVSG